ncbi:MAG: hypothetical protein ACREOO_04635 [bacterium]
MNGALGWAAPEGLADPAFRNVAWGVNRPIQYRVFVTPGSKKRVALGICESYKPRAGMRILDLRVEGAVPQTVDPMAAGRKNHPQVYLNLTQVPVSSIGMDGRICCVPRA